MIGLLGLFAMMMLGFALDSSSSDDDTPEGGDAPDAPKGGDGANGLADGGGESILHAEPGEDHLQDRTPVDLLYGRGGGGLLTGGLGLPSEAGKDASFGADGNGDIDGGHGVDVLPGSGGDEFQNDYGGVRLGPDLAGTGDGGLVDDTPVSGLGDYATGLDNFEVEDAAGDAPVTITGFDGADDILMIAYFDPADPPVTLSFTDNGGSGVTEVSLLGNVTARLAGNIADIGLTADKIAVVNTAL